MTKRKIAAHTIAIIVLTVLTVILTITVVLQNRHINTLGSDLNSSYVENSRLEKLVEEKSMQLIYKDDVYKQETMRDEGIKYQEYFEGLDEE